MSIRGEMRKKGFYILLANILKISSCISVKTDILNCWLINSANLGNFFPSQDRD